MNEETAHLQQELTRALELLRKAGHELDAWCDARPDMAGETPKLVKEIEQEISRHTNQQNQKSNG